MPEQARIWEIMSNDDGTGNSEELREICCASNSSFDCFHCKTLAHR